MTTWRVSRGDTEPDETFRTEAAAKARETVLALAGVRCVAWADEEACGPWVGDVA